MRRSDFWTAYGHWADTAQTIATPGRDGREAHAPEFEDIDSQWADLFAASEIDGPGTKLVRAMT